jgi:hypothetical protein
MRCYAHRVDARIPPRPSALQAASGDEPSHQLGGRRPIDARCCHDVGLAEAALIGDRLQNRKLTRREVVIADMASEQAVSPLAGTMQEMDRRREGLGGPCHRSKPLENEGHPTIGGYPSTVSGKRRTDAKG